MKCSQRAYKKFCYKRNEDGAGMETGINLYAGLPYREVIAAFEKNEIKNTFVVADHPDFDAAMD